MPISHKLKCVNVIGRNRVLWCEIKCYVELSTFIRLTIYNLMHLRATVRFIYLIYCPAIHVFLSAR